MRLRFWLRVMDALTLGCGLPVYDGVRRRLYFWAVGKASDAEWARWSQ